MLVVAVAVYTQEAKVPVDLVAVELPEILELMEQVILAVAEVVALFPQQVLVVLAALV
jgi:hypothetical protein